MKVSHFVKYVVLFFVSLISMSFLGGGAWEVWTAYRFAQHADEAVGTFRGYHGEALPMFSYTDAHGRVHHETGTEQHPLEHLKVGEKVKVLVSRDGSAAARLGDTLSLYSNGVSLCMVGLCCLILFRFGMKAVYRFMGPSAEPADKTRFGLKSLVRSFLQEVGQSHLPISGVVIYVGGFLLIGGAMCAFVLHFSYKRQDSALINALQQQQYESALAMATQGRGVEGQTAEGETALIMALKANQPGLARAILNCWFVNANVYANDKRSSAQLAGANGDLQTLVLLLQKGAPAFGLEPSLVRDLIVKGNAATLKLILDNGYDLHQKYKGLSFGDYAVMEGHAEIVGLIQAHHGLFQAPATFIALALHDATVLRTALNKHNALKLRFRGYSLEQFAKKIGRQALLAGCLDSFGAPPGETPE